jgi:hypothetical protein
MFNRLEHLSEGVATRDYAIGRLIDLGVRRDLCMNLGMVRTSSRIPRMECITFA